MAAAIIGNAGACGKVRTVRDDDDGRKLGIGEPTGWTIPRESVQHDPMSSDTDIDDNQGPMTKWELIAFLYDRITAGCGDYEMDDLIYAGVSGRMSILENICAAIHGEWLPNKPRYESEGKAPPKTPPKLKVVPKAKTYENIVNPMGFFKSKKKDDEPLH